MIRPLTPIDDEELRAQLVRLRRAADIPPRGKYGSIPDDRRAMLRRLDEWAQLLNGALWTDDSWETSEQHQTVIVQIRDVLARARKPRPGTARDKKYIHELVPGLVLTKIPDGWLHLTYVLARDLAGGPYSEIDRVPRGVLHAVSTDPWSRLAVEADVFDGVGQQAVDYAKQAADQTCELCGDRGAITRFVSWAGIGRVCWRHEP
ncbi:hypothetical protein GCM10022286_00300 [Gryllotalpicola daejeonensis]|uniref:Uncharacterized protein n=1 Tax=Gryllotalpicola daejeonensis TaxID=993087 RepID=A0ABP7ZCT1_9MICO